jgi:hypothetical protein
MCLAVPLPEESSSADSEEAAPPSGSAKSSYRQGHVPVVVASTQAWETSLNMSLSEKLNIHPFAPFQIQHNQLLFLRILILALTTLHCIPLHSHTRIPCSQTLPTFNMSPTLAA